MPREKLVIIDKVFGTVPEEKGIFNFPYEKQMAKSKDYVNKGGELLLTLGLRKSIKF